MVNAELLQAYLETDYVVGGTTGFVLRIGEPSQALFDMQRNHEVDCSAFVTAWNPCSRKAAPVDNHRAHAALEDLVRSRGWHAVPGAGRGRHPGNDWPAEESLLILGPTREDARILGALFRQNAVVWAGKDAVPQLLLLWGRTTLAR